MSFVKTELTVYFKCQRRLPTFNRGHLTFAEYSHIKLTLAWIPIKRVRICDELYLRFTYKKLHILNQDLIEQLAVCYKSKKNKQTIIKYYNVIVISEIERFRKLSICFKQNKINL